MPDFEEGDIVTVIDDEALGEGVILELPMLPTSDLTRVRFPDGPAVFWFPVGRLRFERRPVPDDAGDSRG